MPQLNKLPTLVIIWSPLISLTISSGELGTHESNAIDNYCDAWAKFDKGGDWIDPWDSIDVIINDKIESDNTESYSSSNIYDKYYASECQRIRRSWNSMSNEDRSLYIDGLLELRQRGELKMELDEFVAIGSVHDDYFGSVTHHDSDYMFWHGYLIWELESRIRNLGGKYKCFGMPYWDMSDEYLSDDTDENISYMPKIFQTGLGGYGDPNDQWRVNGFSWDVTTKEFWSPDHNFVCSAQGDECPICSIKREGDTPETYSSWFANLETSEYYGEKVATLSNFVDFQQWMVSTIGLPHSIDNSFDPIWYLFHSWEGYLQAMWVNCHNYDLIDVDDLINHPSAFTPYCDPDDPTIGMTEEECVGINLNDKLFFEALLPKREWSYIHNNELTIKQLYSLPQWNVIYDLNGDDFFLKSGLYKECGNDLNEEWFILPTSKSKESETYDYIDKYKNVNQRGLTSDIVVIIGVIIIFCVVSLMLILKRRYSKHVKTEFQYDGYGSIPL